MIGTKDTRRLPLDGQVDDAFLKQARAARLRGAGARLYLHQDSRGLVFVGEDPGDSQAIDGAELAETALDAKAQRDVTIVDLMSAGVGALSRAAAVCLASTQLNLVRLKSDDRTTAGADFAVVAKAVAEEHDILVEVSPDLLGPRGEAFSSSLFLPSGAYLTWVAMMEDEADEPGG